jgi:hypothetical protein
MRSFSFKLMIERNLLYLETIQTNNFLLILELDREKLLIIKLPALLAQHIVRNRTKIVLINNYNSN